MERTAQKSKPKIFIEKNFPRTFGIVKIVYDLRLIRLLLAPSLLSGGLTLALGVLLIGYNAWLYVSEEQLFYDYLFGSHGLKTYIWQHSDGVNSWQGAFLGNPIIYYVLVGAAAIAVGLVVYFLLQLTSLVFKNFRLSLGVLQTQNKTAKIVASELFSRLLIRVLSIVCWGLYGGFFISIILPFVFVLNRLGVDSIHDSRSIGWLSCFGALFILMLTMHLHVIFVRLVFLRPRLFGGDRAIEIAEAEANMHDIREN